MDVNQRISVNNRITSRIKAIQPRLMVLGVSAMVIGGLSMAINFHVGSVIMLAGIMIGSIFT